MSKMRNKLRARDYVWTAVATLAMVLAGFVMGAKANAGTHGLTTRTLDAVHCGPVRCWQHVTITRPWLDTGQTMTTVKTHSRPVEGRNSITPPWGRWRIVFGFISGTVGVRSGAAAATGDPIPKDPCFVGTQKFMAWYDGARWADSLTHVEQAYFNCSGFWQQNPGSWNGHPEKDRVYPRSDGGQTIMTFAWYDNAPNWRTVDEAETGNSNIDPTPEIHHKCQWPRDGNGPCSTIDIG